tara:strand:- start:73 stop:1521 length:1449 start_codon:yes stop_codon:yes gene_type:complete
MEQKLGINKEAAPTLIKNTGFSPEDNIFELTDGSIDSQAKNINIDYKSSEKFKSKESPDAKYVRVSDDGTGFDNPYIGILEELGQLGKRNKSKTKKIGEFGFGTTVALASTVMEGGDSQVKSIDKKNRKATVNFEYRAETGDVFLHPSKNNTKVPFIPSGTTIVLNGLKTSMSEDAFRRLLSVTYYPSSHKALGDSKGIHISLNNIPIEFHNPLFDNIQENEGVLERDEFTVDLPKYGLYKVRWTQLFPEFVNQHGKVFTGIAWEKNSNAALRSTNSGIYWKRNGRYTSLGSAFFGKDTKGKNVRKQGHNLNGVRIEIENIVPCTGNEKVTESAEINKSNVSFKKMMDDLDMKLLWEKVSKLVTERESVFKTIQSGNNSYKVRNNSDILTAYVNSKLENLPERFQVGRKPYVRVERIENDTEGSAPICFHKNGEITPFDGLHTIVFKVNKKSNFYIETADADIVDYIYSLELFLRDNDDQLK